MHRRVVGLREVTLAESPWGKARPRGAKARGVRFEKGVAKLLPQALHNQWFHYVDNNGPGFCSPDILFSFDGPEGRTLCVAECKLTDWSSADGQLQELYLPVLKWLWPGEILPVVVAKHLTPLTDRRRLVTSWDEALATAAPILHGFSSRELAPPSTRIYTPAWRKASVRLPELVG